MGDRGLGGIRFDISRILLSTEVCISDKPDDDAGDADGGMGEDMDY